MIKNKVLIYILAVGLCVPVFAADESIEAKKLDISQKAMSNPDYYVLPGDIYKLFYNMGGTAVEYSLVVDSNYNIRVSNLGVINVKGKRFPVVKKQVETLVSQNYPLSAVQFILIAPSLFTVTVKGAVSHTAEVNAWSLTRVSSVLGDLRTSFSSKRKVLITSANGETHEYDLFRASRDGELSQNPYLRPGDIITVPRAERIIHLHGAVDRPGSYELLAADTLRDVIERYGDGFTARAGVNKKELKVSRITESAVASAEIFIVDFEKDGMNFELQDKDSIYVESTVIGRAQIYLELPGKGVVSYSFTPGDDAVAFVRKNNSLFTSATADTGRAYILRGEQRIPFNLNPILFDAAYTAVLPFEAEDRLIVPNIAQMVLVTGAVIQPGKYPYMPGRTFEYYISLAGGFDYERNARDAVIIRDAYGKKLDKKNIIGPDTIITARSNAFMYNFNMYAPIITVSAAVLTAVGTILAAAYKK